MGARPKPGIIGLGLEAGGAAGFGAGRLAFAAFARGLAAALDLAR